MLISNFMDEKMKLWLFIEINDIQNGSIGSLASILSIKSELTSRVICSSVFI